MNLRYGRACRRTLREVFQVPGYRPGQKAAVACLLAGEDLMALLPTGAGKSLCWQLPAVVHEGLTLVVTPLIALMQDQVASLEKRGIPAVAVNSAMPPGQRREALRQVRQGKVRILFVAPERLWTADILRLCQDVPPWLLVVDEAHCVVQWGESFRPAYAEIGDFVAELPRRPVLCAMTATADRQMQLDIAQSLRMDVFRRVTLPLIRENLHYSTVTAARAEEAVLRLMRRDPCRTVVFCHRRRDTERMAALLCQAGYAADFYHAGRTAQERTQVQTHFASGALQVLATTTAFGMGVDIPDVRRVILAWIPATVTDLVQQTGRAGRDGQDAECVILVTPYDLMWKQCVLQIRQFFTRWRPLKRLQEWREGWLPTRKVLRILLGKQCIPRGLAAAFGQRVPACGTCSACRGKSPGTRPPDLMGMTGDATCLWLLNWQRKALAKQRGVRPAKIMTESDLARLYDRQMLENEPDAEVLCAMTRLADAIREAERSISHFREFER